MTIRGYEAPADGAALVDTSVFIDLLRGNHAALGLLQRERRIAPLQSSEIVRLELLAGMKEAENDATEALLAIVVWHPVDERIATLGGELGRQWIPSHNGIDGADLAIAATAIELGARLLTRNIRHFPMITGLTQPY